MIIIKYYNILNESRFGKRFRIERVSLFEDKESKYIKNMIKNNCDDYYKQHLDDPVSDLTDSFKSSLRQHNPTLYNKCLENNANLMMYLRLDFLQNFDIRRDKGPVKYIIGLTRIGIGELGYFQRNANQSDLALLKQLVLFADNNEEVRKELDSNLNGLTFDELKKMLNDRRKKYNEIMKSKLSFEKISSKGYKVVPIMSKEQAEEYGKYTSWCITHGSYDSYAKNGSRFYFCLQNGFENVKDNPGESCPLDEYGLSMVSVLVDMDGEPTIVTTRWNHEHDGENNENLKTAEQVQNVLGIPFYQTFKPYTKEELKKMGIVSFDEAKERLEAGEDPKEIFAWVDDFHDGFAVVKLNGKFNSKRDGKYNFIRQDGKLISDKWYDYCYPFRDKRAVVELNGKYNFIRQDGKLISDKWYDGCTSFSEGFAGIVLNGKCNFINQDGKLIFDKWYDGLYPFSEGFAGIRLNGKWNFIRQDGKLISDTWYDRCFPFKDGLARVKLNEKFNLIRQDGKLISDKWYDHCYPFCDKRAVVKLNGKCNFIRQDGKLISDTWYDDCGEFNDGFAIVILNKKWNFIRQDGKLISDKWYDRCYPFKDGLAIVILNKKWNFIRQDGKLISDKWYDHCYIFKEGFARVELNGKYNFISQDGKLISDTWYDDCDPFKDGLARVELNGKRGFIGVDGKLK